MLKQAFHFFNISRLAIADLLLLFIRSILKWTWRI